MNLLDGFDIPADGVAALRAGAFTAMLGCNYRLANLLAALGRAQLRGLGSWIERRRAINERYRTPVGATPGIHFMPVTPKGNPNRRRSVRDIFDRGLCLPSGSALTESQLDSAVEMISLNQGAAWHPLKTLRLGSSRVE